MEGVDPIDLELGPEVVGEDGNLLEREIEKARSSNGKKDKIHDSSLSSPSSEETPLLSDQGRGGDESSTRSSPPIDNDEDQVPRWRRLFRRPKPSAYLLLPLFFLVAVNLGACIAPRIQIYTELVCRDFYHRDQMRERWNADMTSISSSPQGNVSTMTNFVEIPGSTPWVNLIDIVNVANPVSGMHLKHHALSIQSTSAPPDRMLVQTPPPAFCRLPKVQSQVTRLALTLTLLSGILGSLTTSKWASMSDVKGRVWVIKLGVWGSISTDVVLLAVVYLAPVVSGYWLLTIGAIADGMFGSFTAASAAFHAYISDCIPARDRVSFFSIMIATFFIGLAIGPTLGAYIIHFAGDIMIVFWIAVIFHLTFFFIANFILPESLSEETRKKVAQKREEQKRAKADAMSETDYSSSPTGSTWGSSRISAFITRARSSFHDSITPALEFLPKRRDEEGTLFWDLFFISIVFIILFLMMGLYSINLIVSRVWQTSSGRVHSADALVPVCLWPIRVDDTSARVFRQWNVGYEGLCPPRHLANHHQTFQTKGIRQE